MGCLAQKRGEGVLKIYLTRIPASSKKFQTSFVAKVISSGEKLPCFLPGIVINVFFIPNCSNFSCSRTDCSYLAETSSLP